MPYIELSKGDKTLVDNENYEELMEYKWYKSHNGYAMRASKEPTGWKVLFMHRYLTNCPTGMIVDHINGDKLDNRKENLRITTVSQNSKNLHNKKQKATSKYFGVCKAKHSKKWLCRINIDGKQLHLGSFEKEEDAARMFNAYAEAYGVLTRNKLD